MFKGSITALITPFKNGEIDWNAFEKLVEWQIESGTHGLVPVGTTGESPTLSHDEHHQVVQRCIAIAKGRIPVIAGTGSNSTREAISLTEHAQKDGADAALVVTPYYNKPSQDGLHAHFKAIHDATDIPIIIYNIPGRSVIDMSNDTMCKLAELPRIVGVKDATGDLARPLNIKNRLGDSFCQLSGNDDTVTGFLAQGGHGCISVTSNIAPAQCAKLHNAWQAGDLKTMCEMRDLLAPVHKALFCEVSPPPVKYAASLLGLGTDEVRLPLVPASKTARVAVDEAMALAGLISGAPASTLRAHG
ncbi:MAG: 4-hydroxy-tetrahydrodipicolinate synthase [Micavibrio aeruginosavorus]|uniref:4-hydroxy-tetrahydrodipicolinate synthase n=1 Tax=Micavibrio aeruginosavorus TaxID=349221 RepID=A0A2W5N4Q9_9BACT|nr:MAG: 4-hydroxy-tetrahydrodipicolinate synthase [Micavibrio aeruginosavorus]